MKTTEETDIEVPILRETYLLLQELQRLLPLAGDQVETVGRALEIAISWYRDTTRETKTLTFAPPGDTSWEEYDRSLAIDSVPATTSRQMARPLRLNRQLYLLLKLPEADAESEVASQLDRMVRLFIERELRGGDGWGVKYASADRVGVER